MRRRRVGVPLALAVAVVAALAANRYQPAPPPPQSRVIPVVSAPAAQPVAPMPANAWDRDPLPDGEADPFKPVGLLPPPPPPPPPAVAVASPAPLAPPFPYRYFGRMIGPDGKPLAYLTRGDTLVQVKPGEALDGAYRIEKMDDVEIVVVYVPLDERTVINIRSAE